MKIAIVFLMMATMGLSLAGPTPDYCNVSTCGKKTSGKTTMCRVALSTWDESVCGKHSSSSALSKADQKAVVDIHNQLRSNIALGKNKGQPTASNMRKMQWDDELSQMAQALVQQCKGQHDKCRDVSRFRVGQNIFQSWSSAGPESVSTQLKEAIGGANGWYGEIKDMKPNYVDNFQSAGSNFGKIGHYTQVVWADTYLIGCAGANYQGNSLLFICNYGPAGNFAMNGVGAVYKRGPAGSACPTGTKKEASTGLCA